MNDTEQKYQKLVVTWINTEVPGVVTIFVTWQDGSEVTFDAGQFLTLVFSVYGREERRSFSISSTPGQRLAFTVKRIDNGAYSRWLTDKLQVGDVLDTTGVAGLFTLPRDISHTDQLWFFAAGIGITPVISLVETALRQYPDKTVTLIYSNRSNGEAVFADRIEKLKAAYPGQFEVEWLFSNAQQLDRARLNKALVRVLLNEYSRTEKDRMLFYTCGPHDYMRMVIYALEESGVSSDQIRREHFNMNARPPVVATPPDTDAHLVTIITDAEQHTITCTYPDTILKAAKKAGIALPYSCEAGRCGSCAARCTSGKVWHEYNEVLMDMDLQHGSILTCTGYPIGGDIIIEV